MSPSNRGAALKSDQLLCPGKSWRFANVLVKIWRVGRISVQPFCVRYKYTIDMTTISLPPQVRPKNWANQSIIQ